MNKVVNIRSNDERLDIASRWILRMDQGLSAAEEAELQAWMAEDRKNAERLLSMAKRWDKMQDLSRLAELFPEPAVNGSAKRGRLPLRAAAAVMAVVAVVAGGLWFADLYDQSRPDVPVVADNAFETAVGEQSTITLEDGSTVVLNTNTLMRVRYSPEARIVELERGEIHVDVVSIADRPFSVVVGDRVLQAVGTSFSVEITDEQHIELIVTEGKVIVGAHPPGGAAPTAPLLAQSTDNAVAVAAGEEMLLGSPNQAVTHVSAEEIEVRLSWRDGRLIFNDEPLEQALAEVERYTTVEFVFVDEDLKTRSVTGRFRTGDVEGLLTALRMNFDIVHERTEDGRVLLSSL